MIELPIVNKPEKEPRKRKPDWLRVKLPIGQEFKKVRNLVDKYKPVSYTHLTLPTTPYV